MANIKELIEQIKGLPTDRVAEVLTAKLEELDQTHSLISKKTLIELERDEAELRAYEFGGIDNWEWRYDSLKDHYDDPYPDDPGARTYN